MAGDGGSGWRGRPRRPAASTGVLAVLVVLAVLATGCSVGRVTSARGHPANGKARQGTAAPSVSTGAPASIAPHSLAGKVIVVDPGHNGANGSHPEIIDKLVDAGNGVIKPCNTTGTAADDGYPESAFNWDVAGRLRTILTAAGAKVVLTRDSDNGVGPCITERAAIANRNAADVMVSIHGDGATAGVRGFHVIGQPDPPVSATVSAASHRLAESLRDAYRTGTGLPYADYVGNGTGLVFDRGDLGGLNLSTRPAALIECGNMRNAADAAVMESAAGRQRIAAAIAAGITRYLTG